MTALGELDFFQHFLLSAMLIQLELLDLSNYLLLKVVPSCHLHCRLGLVVHALSCGGYVWTFPSRLFAIDSGGRTPCTGLASWLLEARDAYHQCPVQKRP